MNLPDIDIDMKNRNDLLDNISHIPASMIKNNKIVKHTVGVYFQNIPYDPIDNISTIVYKDAEERGYFKIDFLNVSVYQNIKDEEHLIALMNMEPYWEMLEYEEIVNQLFQISGNFAIVNKLKPKSIEQLAMTIAIIRPAKKYLINKTWDYIKTKIWIHEQNDEYFFKKSHAISYALLICVQMNLLMENVK